MRVPRRKRFIKVGSPFRYQLLMVLSYIRACFCVHDKAFLRNSLRCRLTHLITQSGYVIITPVNGCPHTFLKSRTELQEGRGEENVLRPIGVVSGCGRQGFLNFRRRYRLLLRCARHDERSSGGVYHHTLFIHEKYCCDMSCYSPVVWLLDTKYEVKKMKKSPRSVHKAGGKRVA